LLFSICESVSGETDDCAMKPALQKYKVARRVNLDFEVVVQARNESEATYNAESIELDSWEQSGASWEIVK